MKISKLLMAGALAFSATLANASTILYPTDGDVNFLIETGSNVQLAIFNDSDAVAPGLEITGAGLTVALAPGLIFDGGVIDFTGTNGSGVYQASNQTDILNLDTANDDFIVGMSNDGGLTWYADTGFLAGPANSGILIFDIGNATITVDVKAVPVPAAAWLFGSGLIGLVGVARRRA